MNVVNNLMGGGNSQSLADRINAAKCSITGQGLAKAVSKATTEEVIGPKRKHVDCKLEFTQVTVFNFHLQIWSNVQMNLMCLFPKWQTF